jgi:hypothetical protein
MYNLTYEVRKQYPDLTKKRSERVFQANRELATQMIDNHRVKALIDEFDFAIQITI